MKNIFLTATVSIIFLFTTLGCQSSCETLEEQPQLLNSRDALFQYSTIATLLQGVYDGNMTCGELKERGDFGLGTFNALDGEMILLDSHLYKVPYDGKARVVEDEEKIPFAAVTEFEVDKSFTSSTPMECSQLKEWIDRELPTKNIAYAIKIEGLFSFLKTRSVAKQTKPYPPLSEVVKTQVLFEFTQQRGSIVGFRLPSYMAGVNAAGYHFHFLTQDRDAGGHLLECQTQEIVVEIDYMDKWEMLLPSDDEFYEANTTDELY